MTGAAPASGAAVAAGAGAAEGRFVSIFILFIAAASAIWYLTVLLVQAIGVTSLYHHYSSRPASAACLELDQDEIPHVTILRPVKGLEPQLYDCLAATFRLNYPRDKLTIYLCVSSSTDPAYPLLRQLIEDFPGFDAKLFVEEDDPNLGGPEGHASNLGPNPKIRNLSRGYREAKGDIIWVIDCNVWISKGSAGRMVDKLCGFGPHGERVVPHKFVHQLPLAVDGVVSRIKDEAQPLLERQNGNAKGQISTSSTAAYSISHPSSNDTFLNTISSMGGGRLEEMFLTTTHAKFYTAINTVSIAPCAVGKSNMFRRSHLDYLTAPKTPYSPGIDYFSDYICEDHLIGDLLWREPVAEEKSGQTTFGRHALVFGDIAIQPMARMSVREYIARRVRWLRVRKWTVLAATLVEPGVESLLCSLYGAFALTTLPIPYSPIPHTWSAFALVWLLNVTAWCTIDWFLFARLHSGASVERDADTPAFACPPVPKGPLSFSRRPFLEWLPAWLGREFLALPIWIWAVWGGTTVVWRGKKFWVDMDMKVYEIDPAVAAQAKPRTQMQMQKEKLKNGNVKTTVEHSKANGSANGHMGSKVRQD